MANRFLDTNYYKSPFVRSLKGALKSLYSFIICDCDGAGIWNMDLDAASLYTGFTITPEEFDNHFVKTGKAVDIGKNKYFFPDFIEHQYPQGLQAKNPAHRNFIGILKKFELIDENLIVKKGALKELESSIGNGKGNGKGLGNGHGKGKGHEGGLGGENFLVPKMCKVWYDTFPTYTADKDSDFEGMGKILSFISRQAHLKQIEEPDTQEKILNTLQLVADEAGKENFWANKPIKSIANNIQEFYNKIKNQTNGGKQSSAGGSTFHDKVQDQLKKRIAERRQK